MDGWRSTSIGQIATFNYGKSLPADSRIPGSVPVYGSNGIVGWHNRAIVNSPGIIVGRKGTVGAVQYSPVPFCPIDTTYFITQDDSSADLCFLAYLLRHAQLSRLVSDLVPGLNRDSALASVVSIPSDYAEQRQIAAVLSAVQRSVERQERLIALTTELRKALMHHLFSEGTRGEPLKQTEIGLVPESWNVATIGELFKFSSGKPRPEDTEEVRSDDKPFPVFGGNGVMGFASRYLLEQPALVIGRVGVYCGCAHHTDGAAWISDNALYAKWVDERIDTRYAREFLEFANLNQHSSRAAQPLVTQGILSGIQMPLPPKEEQQRIKSALAAIADKIERHRRGQALLTSLFRTLLHRLMTAQVRVRELNLSALEEPQPVAAV